jgi:CBS domain-containing protein
VVFRLDDARDAVTRRQEQSQGGRHRADHCLDPLALSLLIRRQLGHVAKTSIYALELAEIMTSSVVTAPPTAPAREVAAMMRDRNVGSVVLADEAGRPVGIVTDRDLALCVVAEERGHHEPVQEFATTPVVTGETGMDLEEAAALMVEHRIRRLPVMESDRLAGIVTLDDIAVRTGNLEIAQQMTAEVARAALPEFYFHQRGG